MGDVLSKLCELIGIADLVGEEFGRVMLRVLWLMHRCGYTADVTLWNLAYAAVYAKNHPAILDALRKGNERLAARRLSMLVFLAHGYLVDVPCFLVTWHKYVFTAHCSLEDLNQEL